ncbi:MAG: ribosome biogenesis factor YjgA [Betaproteobacteria bacterium]
MDQEEENSISKSQKKRDMLALQDMGAELVELSVDTLKKMDLPEQLLTAVLDCKRIPTSKHGGFKRQMQYIGKVMRNVEAAPIAEQLQAIKAPNKQQTALHHLAERWRERLLEDATAVGAFINEFPEGDRALIERYVQASKDEKAKSKPPKHFRLLYQALHDLIVAQSREATEAPE